MREAAAMAKKMGFDQDFGPQAANMWKMLDDLALTDSAAYAEMAKAGAEALRKPQGKFFVPVAGFVVKASLARPWAPSPSANDGDGGGIGAGKKVVENAPAGTKVFINLCGHEGVSPPIDQADRPVDDSKEGRNASGLRIPMFVSRVRETTDHSNQRALAVDVVFHPWVMRSCKGEPIFRDQVVALATGWITQEHPGLVVARRRKLLKLCTYKGGEGSKGATPVAFPIEDASLQTDSPEDREKGGRRRPTTTSGDGTSAGSGGGGVLDDPKSLLAAIKHSATEEDALPSGAPSANGGGGGNRTDKPSSAAATVTTPAGEVGQGPAAALGLKPTGGGAAAGGGGGGGGGNEATPSAKRDILLPGALAGLTSAGRSSTGNGSQGGSEGTRRGGRRPGQGQRGPLISEIVPVTAQEDAPAVGRRGEGGSKAKKPEAEGDGGGGKGGGRPSVIKKGFLSSSSMKAGEKGERERPPLYPPAGSENGSEPSAYVKLMSRCKVVDTRDHNKEEMDAAMKAHASGGGAASSRPPSNAPPPVPGTKPSRTKTAERAAADKPPAVKKGFLDSGGGGGVLYGEEGSREGGTVGRAGGRSSKADREFDRLVALADPEMGDGAGGTDSKAKGGAEDPITEQLAQLAKILGPAAPFSEPAPAATGTGAGAGAGAGADGDLGMPPRAPAEKGGAKKAGVGSTVKADTNTPRGVQKAASTAAAEAQKAATPPTPPETPAPTSTITRGDDIISATAAQECAPGRTAPSSPQVASAAPEKATSAAAASALKESEPTYRVEEVAPPSADHGGRGGGEKRKRAFVVTIELPDLIGGNAEASEGVNGADGSGNSGGGSRRTEKAKGPSLSDFELDVLPAVLELRVPGKYRLRLEMPCIVDDETVSAKFNKSRAVLKVSVQEK
eukprot:g19703.t1